MKRSLMVLLFALCAGAVFPSAVSDNRQGNRAFKQKKYDDALREYHQAEVEAPEEKAIPYNLGNAYYKTGDYKNAAQSLQNAAKSADPNLKKKALFNMGNSYFRADSLKDALQSYKDVLKLDPSDVNAKFNLQKTLLKMEQQKQDQSKNKDDKDKDKKDDKGQNQKNDQDKNSKGDQGDSTKQNGDKNKDSQANQKQDEKKDQQEASQDRDGQNDSAKALPPPKPGQMSEAEARSLLESLRKDEGEWQKKRLKKLAGSAQSEKDW